ncbi:MAG: insulinase family protein [Alphaproteobacteria bacterium]|nr:MAG: insulinase family protein [Alphaproteobacteria bacterium]
MSVVTSRLANGMRVVTHAMPHLETVSLGVWVGAGARCEQPGEHGISHLLEHMAFKGTARRTARQLAEEIESVGGDLNAATSAELTAYYVRVMKPDVPLALDILADILSSPRFDEAELAREKEVILQEIAAAQDSPDDLVHDLAQEAAFPGQALGRPILGTAQSVSAFTTGDLERYLAVHYAPGSMVLAAAGGVDHDAFVRRAEAAFAALPERGAAAWPPAHYQGGIRVIEKPFEQNHMVLGFRGPSFRDESFFAGQVLSSCLGGGMSSRLFQEAREQRGLCYAIYSYCWGLSDTGLFGIHSATGADQMTELLAVVTGELARIAAHAPGEEEIERARAQLKAGLLMSLESSSARAEQLARHLLAYGRVLETDELIARVDAVSAESVRALAEQMFTTVPPSIALVGTRLPRDAAEKLLQGAQPVAAAAQ